MEYTVAGMQNALYQLQISLADWLDETLRRTDTDFWENMVLPKLTFDQNNMIKENNKTKLQDLDFSSILRIFEQNWSHLWTECNFNSAVKSYIHQLKIIRNKYAHVSSHFNREQLFPDFQIIRALLMALDINPELQQEIESLGISHIKYIKEIILPPVQKPTVSNLGDIGLNDIVIINADPNKTGVVLGINGEEYSVFIDGETKPFYKTQISKKPKETAAFVPISTLRNYLSSYVTRHPATSRLYSLNAARIDLIPYQFKPVMKIINADQPRLLIADSVGIGKTIEAGLILRELQIRNDVKSVLIICPRPLVAEKKWEQEMKRFDEEFEALDSRKLRYCIQECDLEGEWPEKYQKIIIPYSICDEECFKQLDKLNPFPKFDLVIVDEAHNIRNQTAQRHQVVKKFCDTAEAVVFLTATPIQLGNKDLYTLLNLLRPDLIPDEETFEVIHTPNRYINQAIQHVKSNEFDLALKNLQYAAQTDGGKFISNRPDFKEITEKLKQSTFTHFTREEIVYLAEGIARLHTFNSLINRTLRKEIATDFAIRNPETVRCQMTPAEREIFTEFLNIKAEMFMGRGIQNVNFVMTTIERQAASCIHGLAPLIKDIFNKSTDFELYDDSDEEIKFDANIFQSYRSRIHDLIRKAEQLDDTDPKYDAFFKEVIQGKQALENKKVIVFSTFRHTLSYLYQRLKGDNIRVGLIHGGVKDEERELIRKRFEKQNDEADTLDVLLFSEVGCEGLDYQFCDTMVNYDLPWNPMKIEQRIGRIDRFGQKSGAVAIYNMIVDNTIDAHIYDRCLSRINIFKESIGDCDEILGEIHTEIQKVCLSTTLTDEQKQQKLEMIGDNQYRYIMEQRNLEEKQGALFVIPDKLSSLNGIENFEDYWVSPLALENLTDSYLQSIVSTSFQGSGEKRSLRLSKEAKQKLLADYEKLPHQRGKIYKDWEKYLKGDEQYCSLTFDIKEASKDKNIQFIMPLHPLVVAAAKYFEISMPIKTSLQIVDNTIPEGTYPFMVYAWEYKGTAPSVKLKPVCDNERVANNILTYLEIGSELNEINITEPDSNRLKELMRYAWENEIKEYKVKVKQLIDYKINSLETSSQARINVASRNNLVQIREKMIENIQNETVRKKTELINQGNQADIFSKSILAGVIQIVHE